MFRVILALALLFQVSVVAIASNVWHIVALDDGATYNVQIDGYDVLAYGDGMIKEVVADAEGIDYRIKILADESVVGITPDGEIHQVYAATDEGNLPVVTSTQLGHTIDLKVIRENGEVLGVKAFGVSDNSCHVKGIDFLDDSIEGFVFDVSYAAHVKAICF